MVPADDLSLLFIHDAQCFEPLHSSAINAHFRIITNQTYCNCNVGGECARQQRSYGTIGVVGLGSRARWGVGSGRG